MGSHCGGLSTNYSRPPVDTRSSESPSYSQSGGRSPGEMHAPSNHPNSDPYDIADQTPGKAPSQGQQEVNSGEKGLLDAINKARREHGLNALTLAPNLNQAAQANDAANNGTGQLGHHIDIGKYGSDGEITGWASNGMTPDQAVQMWLNSPGHRAILLDPNQTQVGVSLAGNFATADFV